MWRDGNDKIDEVFAGIDKIEKFPTKCPVCGQKGGHICMQIHNEASRRGGLWIWCSACGSFSHCAVCVPEYWENCSVVEVEKLCAIPEYLDGIKDALDQHANAMLGKISKAEYN